ncbi:MAG: acetyl-CoA hydrolase/transferase C-terminal domain-containing protein [Chloroflexota bacterium]|nr:acetyl-CoA hydrolase/transferase C-terminal domain-containing protein [Chloroflexota bacterium]
MNWRSMVADKLTTPEEAVKAVRSGDSVAVQGFTPMPFALCQALYERRHELRDVTIIYTGFFPWVREEADRNSFHVISNYATAVDRDPINAGLVDYIPVAAWTMDDLPPGYIQEPDFFLVPVSPPDRNGYCSFGSGVWYAPSWCRRAKRVIAEVHEDFIRTGGKNYVHISEIDVFVEGQKPPPLPIPARSEEEVAVTEVICTLVAQELVRDRDTVQVGIGTVSSALALYLGDKHDLGFHTEVITGGVPQLVASGVATGRYKGLHEGKVVASGCVVLSPEELAMMDGNPVFELYEFGYVTDMRVLVQQRNYVCVNNALFVDLTGQVVSETIGTRIWAGVGGQTAFMVAAQYTPGGRSVMVVPSSHLVQGERRTRIVPVLPEGSAVTVPRTFVDYVVTEYGIATLRGKSIRERIGELIAVAHPDFRGELRREARRLYGVAV